MDLDLSKIDEAVLALLCLGLHSGTRAWKSFDWATLDRLHQAGWISDPRSTAKSVVFSPDGLARAEELLQALFSRRAEQGAAADPAR